MKREPLLIWSSVLVTLQVIAGGAALGDVIGGKVAGLCILIVAGAQAGTSFYVRGQVTPTASVLARTDSSGASVAGPASGIVDGHPVAVTPVDTALAPTPPPRRARRLRGR